MIENSEHTPGRLDRKNGEVERVGEDDTAVIGTLLTNSQNKYQGLFEATPVSLWEEDFSEVKKFVDQLKHKGIDDFRAYFDAHPELVAHCIGLVRVIDVNQATLQMYKAKNKEMLFKNLDKIFGSEAFDIFKEELILIGQGGTIFESEGINYTLDGAAIDVAIRWSVSPGFEESLSQIIVSSIDITETKRASEQLRLQATALESVANAIVISDNKGDVLWVNPAFTKLTGYSYNEVLGKNPRILQSGENGEELYQELWSTIRAGQVWHGEELINRHKDGSLYHEQMTIAPVKDANGNISRFVAIKENITERKQLEIKLRQQLKEEEVLRQIVSLTTSKNEFSEIVATICELLAKFFNVPTCSFAVLDEESMHVDMVAEYMNPQAIGSEYNLISIMNLLPIDLLMAQKTALMITDVRNATILEPVQDILQGFDNASAILIPVCVGGQIKGVFEFATLKAQEFARNDISLIEQITTQISQALKRIRAEEELEAQRDFAHQVMNNMGQGLVVANTNWFIEYSNPTFAKMLGYRAEELVGKSVLDLVFNKNKKRVDQVQNRWLNGEVQMVEMPLMHVDGSTLHVLMTAVPRYIDGQIKGAIAVITDLTERKQMETQLRRNLQAEELLRRVVSLTSTKTDLIDTLTNACEELAKFYQLPKSAFALINEERTQAEVISEYCESGQPSSLGNFIPIANNASMEFLIKQKKALAIKDAQHDPIMAPIHALMAQFGIISILLIPVMIGDEVVGTIGFDSLKLREFSDEDIELGEKVATQLGLALERQQAASALQRERDFAHQIMGNMGQGLLVLTKERTIRYCNPAFGKILGYENDDLIDKPMMSLLSSQAIYESIQPTRAENQSNKFLREVALKHVSGKDVHVLLTAVPRQNNINESGAIVVVTDLSQQKKIEQALSDARDQAIEASRLKSEFLANMSHEIRTPLNAVIGMTSLMLDSPLTLEQQDFAETIRNSGDVLLSLINDILDFSKIEAGKLELEERPFTVRNCVEEALDVVVTKASEKGLELAYIIDDLVPHDIIGDVTRVRQVFVNLLNNAIKFTDSGEVVLSVANVPNEIESETSKTLRFSVIDTGIGIPEDRLNRLFKSFSQVDASTTRRFGGTGLGLAISKQLVEMMGGNIWVESTEGKGSTFHFTMVTRVANSERHVVTQKNLPHLIGKRLLIVDDNETNRKILVKQAGLWQMLPKAVASGPDAIQLLQQGELFDCAILDMQMPEMDGIMLAAEIRKLRDEKSLPLVMLSSIGDRDEFKESNYFAAFLTKPIKQQFLLETLMGVLSDTGVPFSRVPKNLKIDPEMGKKHPLRILLAEDNLVNQKVASRILERMGYRSDIAADGLEVLEALQRQPYDVVLMDVQMPYMDGVEATEQIRDIWPLEQQPEIIAMTAHALTGDKEKYLNAGMDQYISKPVRIQELLQALMACKPRAGT